MKKLFSALSLVLAIGFASAQQTPAAVSAKAKPVAATQKTKAMAKVETKAPMANAKGAVNAKADVKKAEIKEPAKTTGVKLKKDGTPDKRYKNAPAGQHLKKDGTPDRRFKENK